MFKPFKLFDRSGSAKSGTSLGSVGANSKLGPSAKQYKSLIFNSSSSQYLSRTPASAGNRQRWTWSGWVKRSSPDTGARQVLFSAYGASNDTDYFEFGFDNSANLGKFFWSQWTVDAQSTAVFRDFSAWYHVVVNYNGTNIVVYVNGTSILTSSKSGNLGINGAFEHGIGRQPNSGRHFNGYLAEIHFIDGQALTPDNFGYFDSIGIFQPRRYSGTYGTNGFYLPLNDSSFSELVKDKSGNGNNWTLNGYGSSTVSNVVVSDSPVNNFCTLNPLEPKGASTTFNNGNLNYKNTAGSADQVVIRGFNSITKQYYEGTATFIASSSQYIYVGDNKGYYCSNGQIYVNSSLATTVATYTTGDVIGIAADSETGGNTRFYKNGSLVYTSTSNAAGSPLINGFSSTEWDLNFGQRPFVYSAPSGFKSLCTANLPVPTITNGKNAMDVITYTGNSAARSLTGLSFSPDLVWIKGRNGATDHALYDTTRGVQNDLVSNSTAAATTQSQGVTAFNSDGFTIGTLAKLNTNTSTYVAWAWDKSVINGLDIVSYSGNSSTQTISHNLGVAPSMIFVKTYSPSVDAGEGNWCVYHRSLGTNKFFYLDLTNAAPTSTIIWNNTAPTSSVFSIGNDNNVNKAGKTQIAYCFAEVEGYSKFGSYTGNLSSDGPFVWCGFRPKYVMVKGDSVSNWNVFDSVRGSINPNQTILRSNLPATEIDGVTATAGIIDFVSNGFKMRGSYGDTNANSTTFIFAAFAEHPFKYSRAR